MRTEFNIEDTIYIPSKVVRIEVGSNKIPKYLVNASFVGHVVEISEEDVLKYCLSSKDVDAGERQAEEQEEVCGMWKTEKKTPRAK